MTRKIVLAAAVAGMMPAVASAQYSEDFESYAPGQFVEPIAWENWFSGPGSLIVDTTIVADPAGGGGQALMVEGAADPVLVVERAFGFPVISGAWEMTVWQYTPSSSGQTYFIFLNTYDPAGSNWSIQTWTNGGTGVFHDDYSGNEAPAVLDEWVELRVIVDLADGVSNPGAQYFFYNGELLYNDVWDRDGIGTNKLDGMDLYSAGPVNYFDDISIDPAEITGACCVVDGTCLETPSLDDCITGGGYAWTLFAPCAGDPCPAYVAGEGWQIDAPFGWDGDTTFQAQECDLGDANDEIFAVTIPYAAPWTFSLCGADTIDSAIFLGSAPCGEDLGSDDDTCGVQPELTVDLEPGTYYLTVTSLFGEEGAYRLDVTAPCVSSIDPAGTPEGEACGDDTNGGCNMDIPAFEPATLGVTVAGTVWDDGGTRDTDWYEFTTLDGNLRWAFVGGVFDDDIITCDTGFNDYEVTFNQAAAGADLEMTVNSESVTVFGMISDADSNPSTDCATVAFISPAFTTNPCSGAGSLTGVIEAGSVSCTPSDGDTNDDGVVNVEDLLTVLGDWGCTGACDGDTNCDEVVDVSDLLDVLGNWT